MARIALALWLMIFCGGLFAISIQELAFEADFPIEHAELYRVAALPPGTIYSPEIVESAISRLQTYFYDQSRYYVQIPLPEIIPLSHESMKLIFRFKQIADSGRIIVRFTGLRYFSESRLHDYALITADKPISLDELPSVMQLVISEYQRRGYLFASAHLDSLIMGDPMTAWIRVEEGRAQNPSGFMFKGNKVSRESYLLKSSGLLKQKEISPRALQQAEENLGAKPYIRSARLTPLNEDTLLIEVQEGRMTFLEGVLGIGETDGKRQISGTLNLEFLNLWGTDRGIHLFWRSNPTNYSELSFTYHESGIPSLPLAADIALSRTMQDSLWIRSTVDMDIYYLSLFHKIGFSLMNSSILPGNPESQISRSSDTGLGVFWRFSNTRGGRIPSAGNKLDAEYDYIPGSGKNYGRLQSSFAGYLPIKGKFLAYVGLNYKNNENREAQSYDLYTMGGYASLRGYREDEFRSRRLGWANLEARYMPAAETMLYVFYDQGFVLRDEKLDFNQIGIGTGFKFGTRLGILSIEYGLGYRDNKFSDIGLGMIHLGLDIAL